MWPNKVICMGNTNQFGTNKRNDIKKLNYILNHVHLFWDFPKSPINEYSDKMNQLKSHTRKLLIILEELIVYTLNPKP